MHNSASVATNGTYDGNNANDTSNTADTAVAKAATTTAATSSVNPSDLGQSVTFTAQVSSAGATPTSSVQFKDGGANLRAGQTVDGADERRSPPPL